MVYVCLLSVVELPLYTSATILIVSSCTVLHVLDGGPVSCPGTPESPVERAVSHVVKTMSGEVPPQQTEQGEPTGGVAQPHLKEERCVGWSIAHVYLPSLLFCNSQI